MTSVPKCFQTQVLSRNGGHSRPFPTPGGCRRTCLVLNQPCLKDMRRWVGEGGSIEPVGLPWMRSSGRRQEEETRRLLVRVPLLGVSAGERRWPFPAGSGVS